MVTALLLAAALTLASSCQIVDQKREGQLRRILAEHSSIPDTRSVKFRNLVYDHAENPIGGVYLQVWKGELKRKGEKGTYSGWETFRVSLNSSREINEGRVHLVITIGDDTWTAWLDGV